MRFEGNRSGGFGGRRFGSGGGGGRRFGGGFGGGSGGRSFGGNDEPKPVKVGEEYDVEITETGSRGDGIARVNNFVVFVNGAKQGEKTKIKITDVRDRFAIGEKAGAEGSASMEQAIEGTDDMGEASDVTKTEVAVAEDEESDESDEGDEPSADDKSSESEE